MNLNTPTIKLGKLTEADLAPRGLDYQGRHQTKDTPWPLLDDIRGPFPDPPREPMTALDVGCLVAMWCAGVCIIGLAGVGAWSLISRMPGVL